MMMKIVLKITIACVRCKTCVMKTVAKVEGVHQITIDAEKGSLTVVGDVDPVIVVKELRKNKKVVTIVTVGPYKEEAPKPKPNKDPEPSKPLPSCCNTCRPTVYFIYDEPAGCTIV